MAVFILETSLQELLSLLGDPESSRLLWNSKDSLDVTDNKRIKVLNSIVDGFLFSNDRFLYTMSLSQMAFCEQSSVKLFSTQGFLAKRRT